MVLSAPDRVPPVRVGVPPLPVDVTLILLTASIWTLPMSPGPLLVFQVVIRSPTPAISTWANLMVRLPAVAICWENVFVIHVSSMSPLRSKRWVYVAAPTSNETSSFPCPPLGLL